MELTESRETQQVINNTVPRFKSDWGMTCENNDGRTWQSSVSQLHDHHYSGGKSSLIMVSLPAVERSHAQRRSRDWPPDVNLPSTNPADELRAT